MTELLIAYLAAAALSIGLVLLAVRNHKRGWRKPRVSWLDLESAEALLFVAPADPPPPVTAVTHLPELQSLHQSLVAHGEAKHPAPAKQKDLLRSR